MASAAEGRPAGAARDVFDCELDLGGPVDLLAVRGCVDDATEDLFRDELEEARRTAAHGLDLDVTELAGLSPAGARLLRRALLTSADRCASVRLRAGPGSSGEALLHVHALPCNGTERRP